MTEQTERIVNIFAGDKITLDKSPEIIHEYQTAVQDLLKENYFHLCKNPGGPVVERGPYNLHLSIVDNRLIMGINQLKMLPGNNIEEIERNKLTIPMSPFRTIVKDYFFICESYYNAVKSTKPVQIETIDMAKRSLHNDGSNLLIELLHPNVDVDFDTARRLFTLICALHLR